MAKPFQARPRTAAVSIRMYSILASIPEKTGSLLLEMLLQSVSLLFCKICSTCIMLAYVHGAKSVFLAFTTLPERIWKSCIIMLLTVCCCHTRMLLCNEGHRVLVARSIAGVCLIDAFCKHSKWHYRLYHASFCGSWQNILSSVGFVMQDLC